MKKNNFFYFSVHKQKMKSLLLFLLLAIPLAYSEYIKYPIDIERTLWIPTGQWVIKITNNMHFPFSMYAENREKLVLEFKEPVYLTIPESQESLVYTFSPYTVFTKSKYSKDIDIIKTRFATDPIEVFSDSIHALETVCKMQDLIRFSKSKVDIIKDFNAISIWTMKEIQIKSDNLEAEKARFNTALESHKDMPEGCLSQVIRESQEPDFQIYTVAIWTMEEIKIRNAEIEAEKARFNLVLESHKNIPEGCLSQIIRESQEPNFQKWKGVAIDSVGYPNMKDDLKKILDFAKEDL